ncbi:MAG: hypothetical protein QME81_06980 [bacterium]|nr:hypothetical protein [bacterium]
MAKEYLGPGVFVEEIPSGTYPIQAVGTSTAGFVGVATKGPLNQPMLITNWSQFVKHYGSYRRDSFLAYTVYGFFLNKGKRCYVNRVASASAAIASYLLEDPTPDGPGLGQIFTISALNEGTWGNSLSYSITRQHLRYPREL